VSLSKFGAIEDSLNFLKTVMEYSEDWCIIDHDFFPIKKIEFGEYEILGQQIMGINNTPYLWPGFICGKKDISLSEIEFLPEHGFDSGSGTRSMISQGYKIRYVQSENLGDHNNNIPLQIQSSIVKFEDVGIHYLNASGWMKTDANVLKSKKDMLIEQINKSLNF
jgi:hypothetical protein